MVFTVANDKGGVGKSTVAFNIACYLQKKNAPVMLIDLDTLETISDLNQTREANGFEAFVVEKTQSSSELWHLINNNYEKINIVIDVGGYDSSVSHVAVGMADLVITPTLAGKTDEKGLKVFAKTLRKIKETQKNATSSATVVLNNIRTTKYDNILEVVNDNSDVFSVAKNIIKGRKDYNASLALGLSAIETEIKRAEVAKREMTAILDELTSGLSLITREM